VYTFQRFGAIRSRLCTIPTAALVGSATKQRSPRGNLLIPLPAPDRSERRNSVLPSGARMGIDESSIAYSIVQLLVLLSCGGQRHVEGMA
jgi:hypothetical protein